MKSEQLTALTMSTSRFDRELVIGARDNGSDVDRERTEKAEVDEDGVRAAKADSDEDAETEVDDERDGTIDIEDAVDKDGALELDSREAGELSTRLFVIEDVEEIEVWRARRQ